MSEANGKTACLAYSSRMSVANGTILLPKVYEQLLQDYLHITARRAMFLDYMGYTSVGYRAAECCDNYSNSSGLGIITLVQE